MFWLVGGGRERGRERARRCGRTLYTIALEPSLQPSIHPSHEIGVHAPNVAIPTILDQLLICAVISALGPFFSSLWALSSLLVRRGVGGGGGGGGAKEGKRTFELVFADVDGGRGVDGGGGEVVDHCLSGSISLWLLVLLLGGWKWEIFGGKEYGREIGRVGCNGAIDCSQRGMKHKTVVILLFQVKVLSISDVFLVECLNMCGDAIRFINVPFLPGGIILPERLKNDGITHLTLRQNGEIRIAPYDCALKIYTMYRIVD